jgi:hypothetical protein
MASTIHPPDYCSLQPALDHYLLPPGQECPFCRFAPIATQENPSPAPVTPSTSDSQYIPLARGAVNAQLRANALARSTTVTAASAYRSQAIAKNQAVITPAAPKVPSPFLFTVKVAWAVYSDTDPPTTTWKRFNEHTTVAILHNACISFDTMKDTFRQQLQAQRPPLLCCHYSTKGPRSLDPCQQPLGCDQYPIASLTWSVPGQASSIFKTSSTSLIGEARSNNIMRHCYSTPACPTGRSTNTVAAVQAWPTEMTALSLQVALRPVILV